MIAYIDVLTQPNFKCKEPPQILWQVLDTMDMMDIPVLEIKPG